MMLDNREIAALIWLGIAAAGALTRREVRSSLAAVVQSALHVKIIGSILLMGGWMIGVVRLGSTVSLWDRELAKDTVVWFAASGFVLLLNVANTSPGFFRRTLRQTVGVEVFLTFFANLDVFSLPVELALQPLLFVLAACSVLAARDTSLRKAKYVVDSLLGLLALALVSYVLVQVIRGWDDIDFPRRLREFALPTWLTIGMLPFLYIVSLYSGYELAFMRIDLRKGERWNRLRAKMALMSVLKWNAEEVGAFAAVWPTTIAEASSFAAARQVAADFRSFRLESKRKIAEAAERLRRNAGLDGVDSDGRRLDQREFKETKDALQLLGASEMGWYQNRGHRYREELLELLANQFETSGLAKNHGIQMFVSKEGQAWWAWRRTVTGWCFAIGSSGPPPDQRFFDGPEPPSGFPGEGSDGWTRWEFETANW